MDFFALIAFFLGAGAGAAAIYYTKGQVTGIPDSVVESLQREKEIVTREASSLRQELDKLLREREELVKKYEDELNRKNRQLQAQMAEAKRLSDRLGILQLEKKTLENKISALESRLRSSIPRELITSLSRMEKSIEKVWEFLNTGEIKNYRLITSEEHTKVFARMFAEEKKIFLTSPFLTEDAVTKRLPEIERFLERNGKLFLVLGREWNTVKFGDEGLISLMKTVGGRARAFADNIHHKILVGEKTAVITSYNFLSKNNRLREVGIEIDDEEFAKRLINIELENLKNSQTARKLSFYRFKVVKSEMSTTGKTYRVETDSDELPRIYFPIEIEPKVGNTYEAVVMSQIDGNYSQAVSARVVSEE